jgi:hypothetical protein
VSNTINRFLETKRIGRQIGSGHKPGPIDKKLANKLKRSLQLNPSLSDNDRAKRLGVSRQYVQKWRNRFGFKSYRVQKAPNRTETKNKIARLRARKLYEALLTKHRGCVAMDDETYIKMDFKQIPGKNFYVAKSRGDVEKKFKYVMVDKFAPKMMIWQTLCSCGKKSEPYVVTQTMNAALYISECLEKRLKPFINSHKHPVLFWLDLARVHYAKDTLNWYKANKINFVPVHLNPPNCPELRPIEKYWKIMKSKLKKSGKTVKTEKELLKSWKNVAEKYDNTSVQGLMSGIKSKVRKFARNLS